MTILSKFLFFSEKIVNSTIKEQNILLILLICSRCKLKSLSRMASPKIAASTQCENCKIFQSQLLHKNSVKSYSAPRLQIDFTKYFLFEGKILIFPHCVFYYRCRGFVYRTHMAIDLEKKV